MSSPNNSLNDARKSVAMIAFACTPYAGSEPGVGWQFATCAADTSVNLTVFTRNDDSTHDVLPELTRLGYRVNVVRVRTRLDKYATSRLLRYPRYALWIIALQRMLNISSDRYDIIHHVTYASDWLPSVTQRSARLVWGPVGGSTKPPRHLAKYLSRRGRMSNVARAAIGSSARATIARRTIKSARPAIALNDDTGRELSRRGALQVVVRPNAAIDLSAIQVDAAADEFPALAAHDSSRAGPLNVFMAGRLVEWKGYRIAWTALRESQEPWTLHIFGEGPYRSTIERDAADLIDDGRLILHGAVARGTLLSAFRDSCDVFLFTSLHDSAPWVVAEAALFENPVLCFPLGGAARLAGDKAILLSAADPVRSINARLCECAKVAGDRIRVMAPETSYPWTRSNLVNFLSELYEEK